MLVIPTPQVIRFHLKQIPKENLLLAINTNKACGPDEIPGMVLKMCSDSVALPSPLYIN